jgi:hypothetical protein
MSMASTIFVGHNHMPHEQRKPEKVCRCGKEIYQFSMKKGKRYCPFCNFCFDDGGAAVSPSAGRNAKASNNQQRRVCQHCGVPYQKDSKEEICPQCGAARTPKK